MTRVRGDLTARLAEAQGWRCPCCARELSLWSFLDDASHPCRVRIDRSLRGGYVNSVALCRRCAGVQANSASLLDFYHEVQDGLFDRIKTGPRGSISMEVVEAIAEEVRKLGHDIRVPLSLGRAPIERAPHIAEILVSKQHIHSPEARIARKKRKNDRKAIWQTRGNRRRFSEAQNHRCCYCGEGFYTGQLSSHPRYPTWEHVVAMKDGGSSAPQNIVIACRTCNSMRDALDLTAYEFAEWAADHRDLIEKEAQAALCRQANRARQRGQEDHLSIFYDAHRPLFNYG